LGLLGDMRIVFGVRTLLIGRVIFSARDNQLLGGHSELPKGKDTSNLQKRSSRSRKDGSVDQVLHNPGDLSVDPHGKSVSVAFCTIGEYWEWNRQDPSFTEQVNKYCDFTGEYWEWNRQDPFFTEQVNKYCDFTGSVCFSEDGQRG
ncbi:hypothetical protein STEG23_004462, partial [Scotinomys teguina]